MSYSVAARLKQYRNNNQLILFRLYTATVPLIPSFHHNHHATHIISYSTTTHPSSHPLHRTPHRTLASITTTNTTKEQFNTATEQFFNIVQDRLEHDDIELNEHIDSEYTNGVLTLKHNTSTWIINSHSVTRQLWLSSPYSGPSKYNYYVDKQCWLNERDGVSKLSELLSNEWSEKLDVPIDFSNQF